MLRSLRNCITRIVLHRTVKRYEELGIAKDGPRSRRRRSMNMSSVWKIRIIKHELRF
uniref:Uncharacterized protein n=1 Tax=Heterorhabditis bacteriophora TaxID=37862 RepID=A0A1I7WRT5_HETBA